MRRSAPGALENAPHAHVQPHTRTKTYAHVHMRHLKACTFEALPPLDAAAPLSTLHKFHAADTRVEHIHTRHGDHNMVL